MLKKSVSRLDAQKLRFILLGSIVLLIALSVALFIFARGLLIGYNADVQKITLEANSTSQNLTALNSLKIKLSENKEDIERTKSLVAESQEYAYQDQIIKDISTYGTKAGVEVTGFQFNESNSAAAGGATAPAPAAASSETATAPAAVGGLKTISVSVNLKSPLPYRNAMNFVHLIEQNLTKMQLAGISFSKDAASNDVTVSALTVEVYVR